MGDARFGKYKLIAELGHGGMADVFLAVIAGPAGSGFSKLTVVKRLRQNLAEEPEFVEMLVDEARISARLNHPNVVQTNEVGCVGDQYFLAMEYLDGQPLHRIQHRAQKEAQIHGQSPFPKECQYLVIADALAGLHHAHELADYDGTPLQIVHRDVSPHNVFVTYQGQIKVVDFGIAKAAGRSSETRQGVVKGKVRYMAPEQALGQTIDRRVDVFTVGIMLWEAATGKRLWQGADDMEIVKMLIAGGAKISPREVDPTVPEEIDRICRKALAFKPDDRYQTAEAMKLDLEQLLAEKGWMVPARRQLGPAVAALFEDKRSEIRTIIDQQLAAWKQEEARPSVPEFVGGPPDSTPSFGSASDTGSASIARVTIGAASTASATDVSSATRRHVDLLRKPQIALAMAAGVLLVAIGFTAAFRFAVRPAESRLAPTPRGSAAPVQREIHLQLSTTPADAHIIVDGTIVSSPYDARVPADGKIHIVRVEANGYEPRVETIRYDSDVSFSLALRPSGADEDEAKRAPTAANTVASKGGPTPAAWPPTSATAPIATVARETATVHPSTTGATPVVTRPSTSGSAKPPKPTIDTSEDPWGGKH